MDDINREEKDTAEEINAGETAADTATSNQERKLTRKEKRALRRQHNKEVLAEWKEEKKAERKLRSERHKARPFIIKLLITLGNILVVAAIAASLFFLLGGMDFIQEMAVQYYYDNVYAYETMDISEIRKDCEIDEELSAAVDAMPGYGKDDTWGIYIYAVGSSLESYGEDDLSDMVETISQRISAENSAASAVKADEYLDEYLTALDKAGLELPSPMYRVNKPEASSEVVTEDVIVAEEDGAMWMDIEEILYADISENVDIVLQTGGSKRWSSSLINPNRIQRFLIDSDGFREEQNMPTSSMGNGEAIADFLAYCEENHDADHKIVIFWNHGGASFGFGHDEIFNEMASLKSMRAAFESVYGENPEEVPFEIIGFDACLMAGAEVVNAFDGYGKYLIASEETEPGYGWYYTNWISQLSQDPSMNGAQIGKLVADDYMDFYKAQDIKMSMLHLNQSLCFSVLDIHEGKLAYDAYVDLAEAVLRDTCNDPGAITALSRGARESIHYCESGYDLFNTVDLGILADNVSDEYPQECRRIKDAIKRSVKYNRTVNNLKGSQGISIYFPDEVTSYYSLLKMENYINKVTDSDVIKTLYFYKCAGCLTKEMKLFMNKSGMGRLNTIDTASLEQAERSDVIITEEGNFSINLSQEALGYIDDYMYDLALYDVDCGQIRDYGAADRAVLGEDGSLSTDFDGTWVCLEGQPLATEIIQSHGGITTYRSSVLLDGKDAYLTFSYDEETGEFTIIGAYLKEDEIEGDFVARNSSELEVGSKITPAYECSDSTSDSFIIYGDDVRYTSGTDIKFDQLDNGTYCSAITFTDIRGDEFNSRVVSFDIQNKDIVNTMESADVVMIEE